MYRDRFNTTGCRSRGLPQGYNRLPKAFYPPYVLYNFSTFFVRAETLLKDTWPRPQPVILPLPPPAERHTTCLAHRMHLRPLGSSSLVNFRLHRA
jgi:hypothetical protein